MLRRVGQALIVVGVLGFFGAFCLSYAGTWLDSVELPIFFQTNTIALPDGGRLTATMPLVPVLLVPFWHPFVACLIMLAGYLALRVDRSVARQSS
jgi:hypothetical protein